MSRVLDYPKFDFAEEQKNRFKGLIRTVANIVEIQRMLDVVKEDPSDNMILECALSAGADFVVSSDPHVLTVGSIGGGKGSERDRISRENMSMKNREILLSVENAGRCQMAEAFAEKYGLKASNAGTLSSSPW